MATKIGVVAFLLFVSTFAINLKSSWADEGGPSSNVSLLYGQSSFSSDWEPVDKHSTYGVMFDYNPGNWTVNLMCGISFSSKSATVQVYGYDVALEAKTTELSIGARKYLMDTGTFKPYLSAGLSNISREISASISGYSGSDSSSSIGYFGNGGIMLLMDRFSVGLDLKILTGTSFSVGDGNYTRWAVTGGMNF